MEFVELLYKSNITLEVELQDWTSSQVWCSREHGADIQYNSTT